MEAKVTSMSREAQLRQYLISLRANVTAATPGPAQRPAGIDAGLLATELKARGGVRELQRAGAPLPSMIVDWREPATAQEFLKTLVHVDRSGLQRLRDEVRAADRLLRQAATIAGQHEEIGTLLAAEDERIAAIRSPPDKKDRPAPQPLLPEQLDKIRSTLSAFERLHQVSDSWTKEANTLDDCMSWYSIAQIADAADSMLRGNGDGGHDEEVQRSLDTLSAYSSEIEQLTQHSSAVPQYFTSGDSLARSITQSARNVVLQFDPLHERFLQQPGREGDAFVSKIVASVGNHALLSVSALSGFVGLCGYIKACRELNRLDLSALALVSTADVANFAVAMALPFLLLAAGLIGLPYFWSKALEANHRSTGEYLRHLMLPIAIIAGSYVLFRIWVQLDLRPTLDVETLAWAAILVTGLLPAARLFAAGKRTGVADDDDVQRWILDGLRSVSSTEGLLAGLLICGIILVCADNVRVIVANRLPAGDPASGLRVVEAKNYPEPILAAASPSRVGDYWVLRRAPEPAAETLLNVRGQSNAVSIDGWPLLLLNKSEVACLRKVDDADERGLRNRCVPVAPKPLLEYPRNSLARFAMDRLDCGRDSFDGAMAATVIRFPLGLPAHDAQAQRWTDRSDVERWRVSSSRMQVPALRGVGREAAPNPDELTALRPLLERDLSSTLWILGFASTPGTPSSNLDLAERRAQALSVHLLRNDLSAMSSLQGRLKTLAVGESDLSGVEPTENAQLAIAFVCTRPR